ncbi:hypothetical protein APHAL10511_004792 [Amanita phalloides]|nr:hypothetical protein APHAL10511_004792 [Amanita phalloides]
MSSYVPYALNTPRPPRPPLVNPYDKFTQDDFEKWIGGITSALRNALGHEPHPTVSHHAPPIPHARPDTSEDEYESEADGPNDSLADIRARYVTRLSNKGKARDPMEGPGLSAWGKGGRDAPIEIDLDEDALDDEEVVQHLSFIQASDDDEEEEEKGLHVQWQLPQSSLRTRTDLGESDQEGEEKDQYSSSDEEERPDSDNVIDLLSSDEEPQELPEASKDGGIFLMDENESVSAEKNEGQDVHPNGGEEDIGYAPSERFTEGLDEDVAGDGDDEEDWEEEEEEHSDEADDEHDEPPPSKNNGKQEIIALDSDEEEDQLDEEVEAFQPADRDTAFPSHDTKTHINPWLGEDYYSRGPVLPSPNTVISAQHLGGRIDVAPHDVTMRSTPSVQDNELAARQAEDAFDKAYEEMDAEIEREIRAKVSFAQCEHPGTSPSSPLRRRNLTATVEDVTDEEATDKESEGLLSSPAVMPLGTSDLDVDVEFIFDDQRQVHSGDIFSPHVSEADGQDEMAESKELNETLQVTENNEAQSEQPSDLAVQPALESPALEPYVDEATVIIDLDDTPDQVTVQQPTTDFLNTAVEIEHEQQQLPTPPAEQEAFLNPSRTKHHSPETEVLHDASADEHGQVPAADVQVPAVSVVDPPPALDQDTSDALAVPEIGAAEEINYTADPNLPSPVEGESEHVSMDIEAESVNPILTVDDAMVVYDVADDADVWRGIVDEVTSKAPSEEPLAHDEQQPAGIYSKEGSITSIAASDSASPDTMPYSVEEIPEDEVTDDDADGEVDPDMSVNLSQNEPTSELKELAGEIFKEVWWTTDSLHEPAVAADTAFQESGRDDSPEAAISYAGDAPDEDDIASSREVSPLPMPFRSTRSPSPTVNPKELMTQSLESLAPTPREESPALEKDLHRVAEVNGQAGKTGESEFAISAEEVATPPGGESSPIIPGLTLTASHRRPPPIPGLGARVSEDTVQEAADGEIPGLTWSKMFSSAYTSPLGGPPRSASFPQVVPSTPTQVKVSYDWATPGLPRRAATEQTLFSDPYPYSLSTPGLDNVKDDEDTEEDLEEQDMSMSSSSSVDKDSEKEVGGSVAKKGGGVAKLPTEEAQQICEPTNDGQDTTNDAVKPTETDSLAAGDVDQDRDADGDLDPDFLQFLEYLGSEAVAAATQSENTVAPATVETNLNDNAPAERLESSVESSDRQSPRSDARPSDDDIQAKPVCEINAQEHQESETTETERTLEVKGESPESTNQPSTTGKRAESSDRQPEERPSSADIQAKPVCEIDAQGPQEFDTLEVTETGRTIEIKSELLESTNQLSTAEERTILPREMTAEITSPASSDTESVPTPKHKAAVLGEVQNGKRKRSPSPESKREVKDNHEPVNDAEDVSRNGVKRARTVKENEKSQSSYLSDQSSLSSDEDDSSDASSTDRMLRAVSKDRSTPKSSTTTATVTLQSFYPMLHRHGAGAKRQRHQEPMLSQPQRVKARPASSTTRSSTHSPFLSQRSSTSRATRSNCRYRKISVPKEEDGPRVCFLVPGCSLGNEEVIEENEIEDLGDASHADSLRMIWDIESLDFDSYLIGVLRQLVGVDLLREQEVFYLPAPGEELHRKSQLKKTGSDKSTQSRKGSKSGIPESPCVLNTPRHSATSLKAPSSKAGSISTSASHPSRERGSSTPPSSIHSALSSDEGGGTEDVRKAEKERRSKLEKKRRLSTLDRPTKSGKQVKHGRRLGSDALAYKPGSESEGEVDDEKTKRKPMRTDSRGVKRTRSGRTFAGGADADGRDAKKLKRDR